MVVSSCHPRYRRGINRKTVVQARKQDPVQKIAKAKSTGWYGSSGSHMSSRCKDRSSNPSSARRKSKRNKHTNS
jgi:hypothetical protein